MYTKIIKKLVIGSIFLTAVFILAILIIPNIAQAQYYTGLCTPNYQQRCVGNSMYWYDSCGNQGSYIGTCNNYYNNYNRCTYHAYKLCSGNNIYWYDSCGSQQDLYASCGSQFCQYGACVPYIINPVIPPINNYVAHSRTACYGGSIHWFDSLGVESGLYKSCDDNNACTTDSCSANNCINTQIANCPTTTPAPTTPTPTQQPNSNGLTISFFAKQNATSMQWQKTIQSGPNSQVYFMITVTNNSANQVDNVNISANIPSEISSLGNLQLNGVPISGDIVSGVNIGSIAPSTTKPLTFEGKIQTLTAVATKQAISTSNAMGITQSDTVSINFNPDQPQASVSSAPATSGFWEFLKAWYLWILIGLVLIFLFIIVFKRFSSEA
ncbi:MAG: hypothetical protein WC711_01045 [Candidatus Staskawiczbacteria bacterium]|jgi:hypothetical protein